MDMGDALMRAGLILFFALGLAGAQLQAAPAGVRTVYLNGIDISAAKSQELKNVDISINERGDIFIIAPHYQVHEEDSFVPLSKFVRSMHAPQHKEPQAINKLPAADDKLEPASALPVDNTEENTSPPATPPAAATKRPLPGNNDKLIAKPGEKIGTDRPANQGAASNAASENADQ